MANDILQYLYPEDPTGEATTNKVVGEFQTVNPPDEAFDFNWIIPKAGPYFRDTMRLYDVTTGDELYENVDWAPGHKFLSASHETQYVHGGIYASILFLNNRRSGQVELREYQTLGGNWGLDESKILELLDAKATDPRFVSYEEVNGKPEVFPPIDHNHPADDMTGFRELIEANYDISAAIREKTESFLTNPPILMSEFYTKDQIQARELQQRELTLQAGDVAVQSLPWPDTIGTTANRRSVAATGTAGTGNGGTVTIPAGCIFRLGQKISGLTKCRLQSLALTSAWISPVLSVNSTYYLRVFINEAGDLTPYVQRGTDADPRPAGYTGTVNGPSGGGFDSNQVDMLLARVITGNAGSLPAVLNLMNATDLIDEVSSSGPAANDPATNRASYSATYTLNWARKWNNPNIYATVEQGDDSSYVAAGANYARSISGDRYNIVIGIATDWNKLPLSPVGHIHAFIKG